jgi:hypothetical protein
MAELSLPSSVDFSKTLPKLPSGVSSTLMSVQSTNGISFPAGGSVIQFDLPSRSGLFIDGKTMFIRFRISYTQTATSATILRKPVYSVFSRLDEFVGSVPIASVFAYNQVANAFVDYNYSFADVAGQGASWGLENNTWADVDGFATSGAAGDNFLSVAAPLVCSAIANCDKLIPTGLMAPIRIQLTTEQIGNIVSSTTNISAITIVQPELCFMAVDMGVAVENMVASMAPKLVLKTRGWANSTQNSTTATGFSTYVFNHRYESIENLFFLASNTASNNKWGSSFNMLGDATTAGSFQIQVGQSLFPVLPINNTTGGRASVLQYLRECVGSITDQRNTLCIGHPNFNVFANNAGTDTLTSPAKFIIGLPLSKLNSVSPYQASSLLSGVSAAQMPINVLVNVGTAPAAALSLSLIAEYTELITIDPLTRQVFVEA